MSHDTSHTKLIYMANQIARSFRTRGHAAAVAATAEHISNFWEPRMRTQLFALLDQDPRQFSDIVQEARKAIRPVTHQPAL